MIFEPQEAILCFIKVECLEICSIKGTRAVVRFGNWVNAYKTDFSTVFIEPGDKVLRFNIHSKVITAIDRFE